jgi:hypothetical protein
MRKAVVNLLKKADKYSFSEEEKQFLCREDLSVDILNIIFDYFYANNSTYTSDQLCQEVQKVLSFPKKMLQNEYVNRISSCLPYGHVDEIIGSYKKRCIFYFHSDCNFDNIYQSLMKNNIEYYYIKEIYEVYKNNYIPSSIHLMYNIRHIKNKNNIEILIKAWKNIIEKINKHKLYDHKRDLFFNGYNKNINYILNLIENAECVLNSNIKINQYIKYDKAKTIITVNTKKFYEENILSQNEFIYKLIKKFNMEYCDSEKYIYNSEFGFKDKIVDTYKEFSKSTKTKLLLYFTNTELIMKIKNNNLNLTLNEYNQIEINNGNTYSKGLRKKIDLWITPDGAIFISNTKSKANKFYPLSVDDLITFMNYKNNNDFKKVINLYIQNKINENNFFKDIINDFKDGCLMPLKVNECVYFHNKKELLNKKYKISNDININWNKRNLNLSYLIIKSYPYVDEKGKEILKQITEFDLNRYYHLSKYKVKVSRFLEDIIYNNINKYSGQNLIAKCNNELNDLPESLKDEKQYVYDYNVENDNLKPTIRDYVHMTLSSKARKKPKIKLNIKSVNEIQNKHDEITESTNVDVNTGSVNVPKDSRFNTLRNILPDEFEWIKTRKRLILETKIQHHCVWSYASYITNDESAIYSYVDTDGSKHEDGVPRRYTIEFKYDPTDKKYYIKQVQGRFDSVNASNMTEYIQQILDNYYKLHQSNVA